jgi:hypothetical protein
VGLALLLACTNPADAAEAYYVLMFGAQRAANPPPASHSFATFVRAIWDRPGAPRLEAHTISWLPRTGRIRVLALAPEEGVNLDLHATLRYAYASGERVSLWGAYQIDRDLYLRALAQCRVLESGQVLYKAVDLGYCSERVSNCIHAVSRVADGPRVYVATPTWGETGSYAVLGKFTPWMIDPNTIHTWVGTALGLDAYPIFYHYLTAPPDSGAVVGPFSRLLGFDRPPPGGRLGTARIATRPG